MSGPSYRAGMARRASGFSVIELMIALVLGLLLTMGALSIFLSGRAAFRTTEDLSRVQEAGRIAFELMARDVREAGGNHCASTIRLGNVVTERDNAFWTNWNNSLTGVNGSTAFATPAFGFGSAAGGRVSGTDGLEIHSTEDLGLYVTAPMTAKDSDLTVSAVPSDVKADDVLMVCDFRLASLFKATSVGANAIAHGTGGNCSTGFSRETALLCKDDTAIPDTSWHRYGASATVVRPHLVRWFIGNNDSGSKSLFRAVVDSKGIQSTPDEVAEGVSQMALTYLVNGRTDYQPAASIAAADWVKVKAARVVLTLESERKSGIGNESISRSVTAVLAMRNRNL